MNVFNGVVRYAANAYRNSLRKRLAEYGLKYDDLLIENEDVLTALRRIDPETLQDRERRIKRAFDLSAKKKFMPVESQIGDPLEKYLEAEVEKAKLERQERVILNGFLGKNLLDVFSK